MLDPKLQTSSKAAPRVRATAREIVRIDDFGVPAFWVEDDGPAAAGMVFRSGSAMEPLAHSGVTHLIQHVLGLALGSEPHGIHDPTQGDIADVSYCGPSEYVEAMLSSASRVLCTLPMDDLDLARQQLKQESANESISARELLLMLRHGAAGPGVSAFPEYATRKAGHGQIADWARRHFNKGNMVLWLSGPMLSSLQIRLVSGASVRSLHQPLPVPAPGVMFGTPGSVALSFMAKPSHELQAAARVVYNRARSELCERRHASSQVSVTVERRGRDSVEFVVTADCLPGRDDEVARVLLWALESIVASPASPEEINVYRNATASAYFVAGRADELARASAIRHLTGAPVEQWRNVLEDLNCLTGAGLARAVEGFDSSLLAIMSRDCSVAQERFQDVSNWCKDPVGGARVKPVKLEDEDRIDRELLFAPNGITLRDGDRVSSVRFDECVLMLQGEDGYRELVGEDGGCVVFIAQAWDKGDLILQKIDSAVIPERKIAMDEVEDRRRGHTGPERRRRPR